MKNIITYTFILLFIFSGCKKDSTYPAQPLLQNFTEYIIPAGEHYCNQRTVTPVTLSGISFKVKFDSSAIYTTIDPSNQFDINKLMGFTEGFDPHTNSARIGWSYNSGALRLYAYAYINGVRMSQEITPVSTNEEIICSIILSGNESIFSVNNLRVSMPRAVNSLITSGYLLYPYFGGDETAPAQICIYIKGPDFY